MNTTRFENRSLKELLEAVPKGHRTFDAMAIRLMKMEKVWNHQAFLDYVDRWMNEDDTEHVRLIKEAKGWDYSASFGRQGSSWDLFVTEMYKAYRPGLGPMNWQGNK